MIRATLLGVRLLLALCALSFVLNVARADIDPAFREEGVLYFEDNLSNPIIATVKTPITIYLRRDFQTALAQIGPGAKIELIGMSSTGYLVKGDYRNNTVTGWILPADLPPDIDPALLAQARKNQARHNIVAAAIAQKKVIRGMTPDEVRQSVGRPDQESSRTDSTGTTKTWIFTTYSTVLQTSYVPSLYGRPILQTYPVKVPSGQLIVGFANGAVVSIQEHRTDPDSPGINTD
jgi:hypothetical protein